MTSSDYFNISVSDDIVETEKLLLDPIADLDATNPLMNMSNLTDNSSSWIQLKSSPPLADLLKDFYEYQLALNLVIWLFPLIIIGGTIGNLLSLVVMLRREMRQTSTCFYLATLAITDTSVLYISAFKTWIRILTGFELLHVSNAACKGIMFLVYFCNHFSAWIIVAVTIERFLAVWFPLKAGTMCSVSRAKFGTFVIASVFILVNSHLFWTAELVSTTSSMSSDHLMCIGYVYKTFVCKVFAWINLMLYTFLPFIVLLIFNILIIINLLKHRQVLTSTMTKDDQQTRNNHRKLAITLLTISFVWIITTMPFTCHALLKPKSQSYHDIAVNFLTKFICYCLFYTNHSINFCLYCITGQRFRHEMKKLFCRKQKNKPITKMTFKTSGSGHDSSYPLMENVYMDVINHSNTTSKNVLPLQSSQHAAELTQ
ncbi:hypothetical protein SNE40_012230 [Patella caerulea]|uniref:G-protein coupled receptors family 1 profile domain-containing protein n=1 Tax=Patella caerulea TaxID=87958 RepID=A0AAN8JR30_PATCE